MKISRRDLGKMALASLPLSKAFGARMINSKIDGVQIGAITYSFNRIASPDPEAIIRAYVDVGLGEAELTSDHCEALAGAPEAPAFVRYGGSARKGGGRPQPTPEQQAERQAAMEKLAPAETWKGVRKKFNDAGIEVALLCYNMQDRMKDEDIEYGFAMAKGLGAKAITKLRYPDGLRQIQCHQFGYRPFHGGGLRCGGLHQTAPRQDHQPAREGSQEEPRPQRRGVGNGRYAHQGSHAVDEK
jgi:hypothetical protein